MYNSILNGLVPMETYDPNKLPEINLYSEFTEMMNDREQRDKTKEILDEISKEANELASFFGTAIGIEYARIRLVSGFSKTEAAWDAVDRTNVRRRTYANYNSIPRRNHYDE